MCFTQIGTTKSASSRASTRHSVALLFESPAVQLLGYICALPSVKQHIFVSRRKEKICISCSVPCWGPLSASRGDVGRSARPAHAVSLQPCSFAGLHSLAEKEATNKHSEYERALHYFRQLRSSNRKRLPLRNFRWRVISTAPENTKNTQSLAGKSLEVEPRTKPYYNDIKFRFTLL